MAQRAKYAGLAEKLLQFAIALERRVWWFQTPIRQLADLEPSFSARQKNFPEDALRHLEEKKISLDRLLVDCGSAADLGNLVRNRRAGEAFHSAAQHIPRVHLDCDVVPMTRQVLRIKVQVIPDYKWAPRIHGYGPEPFWLWVEAIHSETGTYRILHSEQVNLFVKTSSGKVERDGALVGFTIAVSEPLPVQFIIRVISDRWLGSSSMTEISTSSLKLPSTASRHTDLLPLHPLPTSALGVPEFERFYPFSHFNPVQTQLFYCLYHTDRNVLLGAPTGSGKTAIAEIAVMRMLRMASSKKNQQQQGTKPKAIYVAPLKALARERLKDWRKKFGKLGLRVLELTGDATPDQGALRDADILVTTPEKWDGVTRLWKQRDYARHAALLIIDEIHLLGEDRGPVIEAIVTRARYVEAKKNMEGVRIVGLSTAISNAGDLAKWLGVDEKMGLYNFRPSVRPVTIEAHVQGYRGKHYCPRMATMNKPCYLAIREHAASKPALVFVASRRQTRLTALDLIAIAGADDSVPGGAAALWVEPGEDDLGLLAARCTDTALRETLPFGVGIHHAGLADDDRDLVERLFEIGKIRVLVCTATLAWGVNFPARLVVIKGTEFYDGKLHQYVDFPITDVLQMMGRAGRPQFDTTGVAVIMVHEPKKDFYKKFLYSPFPVESHLRDRLHNIFVAEICASGSISSMHDAVDFLKWTYFYQRLKENPSFYHMDYDDDFQRSLDEYLKDLVRTTFEDIAAAGAISILDDESSVRPETLGTIAAAYYLDYKTTRDAAALLDHLEDEVLLNEDPVLAEDVAIELLCSAREFDELPVRHNEDKLNEDLALDLPMFQVEEKPSESPALKAQLLIHAKLRQVPLPVADYVTDTRTVLENGGRVLAALIDVAADAGALKVTLALCRLSQALGTSCSVRRGDLAQILDDGVGDLASFLRDPKRRKIIDPKVLGSFPSFVLKGNVRLETSLEDVIVADTDTTLNITVTFDGGENRKATKLRSWWLILGDEHELLAMKRIPGGRTQTTSLRFPAPEQPGMVSLYLVAGDCRGFDIRKDIPISVVSASALAVKQVLA